jgi:hypothetical protein
MTIRIQTGSEPIIWGMEQAKTCLLLTCDVLALTLEAKDAAEAPSLIAEGLQLFFLDHLAEGTLPDLLRRLGWSAELPAEWWGDVCFDVPWSLT